MWCKWRLTSNIYFAIKQITLFRFFYYFEKNKKEQLFNYFHYNNIQKKKKCKKYLLNTYQI